MIKSIFLFFILIIFSISSIAQDKKIIELASGINKTRLLSSTHENFNMEISLKELVFENTSDLNGEFSVMEIKGGVYPSNIGKASLPVISKLIEVPLGAEIDIIIKSFDEELIYLDDYGIQQIAPTQPSYSKSTALEDISFVIDHEYYNNNSFEENSLVFAEYYGIMRGTNIGRIEIRPYHYNPVENSLLVYNNLDFEIKFNRADFSTTELLKSKFHTQEFGGMCNSLINYQPEDSKDAISDLSKPMKYVIVSNRIFEETLQPFIEWKTKMGYNVITAFTDEIGTSNTAIKSYLQGLYESATSEDPAPLYLLIIGDHSGNYSIPAFSSRESGYSHKTDLYFVTFDGNDDYLPDMYYGRISVNSVAELQNVLNKIIPYEQYIIDDGSYLNKCILVSGVDAEWAPKNGDAAISYATRYYYNQDHGFSDIYAYYYSLTSGDYNVMSSSNSGAAADINSKIGAGLGFANYTAHCDYRGWYNPRIWNTNIAGWNNVNKYPFMIGNCCKSYEFNREDSFGEMVLYAENSGAIGYIGGSNNTFWNEDVYWALGLTNLEINVSNVTSHTYENTGLGVYDALWHENNESFSDWFVSGSQMIHRGNLEVLASTSTRKKYYWEIYHLSGDPSLIPYTTEPELLTMSFEIPDMGETNLTIATEPYSYVAISKNGVLLDAKWSGDGTNVVLSFPPLDLEPLTIVGSKQNRAPSINENVIPIATEPPVADFSVSETEITEGEAVSFYDISEYAITWLWNFGDGETSNERNPEHIYTSEGIYTVSLTVTNQLDSDTKTITDYIIVNPNTNPPIAGFSFEIISSCEGIVNFSDESVNSNSWLWDFGDGMISSEREPLHSYSSYGRYTVKLTVTNDYGTDEYTCINCVYIAKALAPETVGETRCSGDSFILSASGGGNLVWYDTPDGDNIVYEGEIYNRVLYETTTYYIQDEIENQVTYNTAASGKEIGAGSYIGGIPTINQGLEFDAYKDFILNSVFVYAVYEGSRIIELINSDDVVIEQRTIFIPQSENGTKLDLNFDVPQGNDYKLVISTLSETQYLYVNSSGASFPYDLEGILSITNNINNNQNSYYYFYNWEITVNEPCISERTEVTAVVSHVPDISISGDGETCDEFVVLSANSEEGATIYWQGTESNGRNTGDNSTTQIVNQNGTYYFRGLSDLGCWGEEASATVAFLGIPVNLGDDIKLCNDIYILDAGDSYENYFWNGVDGDQFFTVNESGEYAVMVINENNCIYHDTINIALNENPIISYEVDSSDPVIENGSITLYIEGGKAPYSIDWDHGNGLTSTIFYPLLPGVYNFTVTDANGCADSVNIEVGSVNIKQQEYSYLIYPNPADEFIYIYFENHPAEKVEIYNVIGEIIEKHNNISNHFKINVSNYNSGLYFMNLYFKEEVKVHKIIIE